MTLNRTSAPKIHIIRELNLPTIEKASLSNGIPTISINVGNQEIVKIQLVFKAGMWYQSQSLQAFFTGQMLEEGSRNFTASDLAEKLDSCGAHVHQKVNRDNASIEIYTLSKHLETVLPLVADMLRFPTFGEAELKQLVEQEKQAFNVRNQQVKHIAQREYSALLFGNQHPYGSSATEESYNLLNTSILKEFHKTNYGSDNCRIFVSGKIDSSTQNLLDKFLGQEKWGNQNLPKLPEFSSQSSTDKLHYLPKENVLQSAIRLGKRSIGKSNPDYFGLTVASTLFGGYFGSRLMSNIREDKGYTYGIYAGIYPHIHDSAFIISSEVGADVAQKAMDEIRYELKRLRTESVDLEELSLVKNYMSGTFLRSLNGAFALGEAVKTLYEFNLKEDYYQNYLNTIHEMTPEKVLYYANKYLHEDQMIELIVGKK